MVKLLDYRDRIEELDASRNPFAIVMKAHLKLQETKKDNLSRKVWKMELVRQLYEAGYKHIKIRIEFISDCQKCVAFLEVLGDF